MLLYAKPETQKVSAATSPAGADPAATEPPRCPKPGQSERNPKFADMSAMARMIEATLGVVRSAHTREGNVRMNTRTIAIIALIIAVIVLLLLLL